MKEAVSSIYNGIDEKVSSDEWDTPEYDSYIARFSSVMESDDFKLLYDELKSIQDVNHVRGLYIVYPDAATKSLVYLVDASPENVCLPGNADVLVDEDLVIFEDPDNGFDPSVTNTQEYGWNIATAKPIYDGKGEVLAYACVDISMNEIVEQRQLIIQGVVLALIVFAAIVSAIASILAGRVLVRPVNALSEASLRYRSGEGDEASHVFKSLDIHTGDEIEILAESMKSMEADIRSYSEKMSEMALTDALTGVKNRRAYDLEIERVEKAMAEGETEVGLLFVDLNDLKLINDEHGHDCGDIALTKLCGIICDVFGHSPVFRIGGDEFVVVLQGRDFHNAKELLYEFNEAIDSIRKDESLEPWERISAAAGLTAFDSECDEGMGAVFTRVEEAMYKQKREMKASSDYQL